MNDPSGEAPTSPGDSGAVGLARRRRLHWLTGRARGDRVLDAASGDGAAALLLAGEGRAAVAVEREPGALDDARRALADDAGDAGAQVEAVADQPGELAVEADAFDTVLLGDSLEDEERVGPALDDARRVLRPRGIVAIVVAYGADLWLDREEPAHLRPLLAALTEHGFAVEEVEPADGYLGIVARAEAGGRSPEGAARDGAALAPWLDALEAAHRRLADRQRTLDLQRDELERREREAMTRSNELEQAERRAARLDQRVRRLEERVGEAKARAEDLRERLAAGEAELGATKEEADRERKRLETLEASKSLRLVRLLWRARSAVRRRAGRGGEGSDAQPSRK